MHEEHDQTSKLQVNLEDLQELYTTFSASGKILPENLLRRSMHNSLACLRSYSVKGDFHLILDSTLLSMTCHLKGNQL